MGNFASKSVRWCGERCFISHKIQRPLACLPASGPLNVSGVQCSTIRGGPGFWMADLHTHVTVTMLSIKRFTAHKTPSTSWIFNRVIFCLRSQCWVWLTGDRIGSTTPDFCPVKTLRVYSHFKDKRTSWWKWCLALNKESWRYTQSVCKEFPISDVSCIGIFARIPRLFHRGKNFAGEL